MLKYLKSKITNQCIKTGYLLTIVNKQQCMKKTLIILILTTLGLYTCGQNNKPTEDRVDNKTNTADTITLDKDRINVWEFSNSTYFHTEADYTDSTGKGIIIQNGFPRGGGIIFTTNNAPYGHAIFWSRVVNKMDTPTEITINFSADSILISPSSNAHFKLLVPPDTMTFDNLTKFSYGLKNVKTFVENNFHQTSQIQRRINPNEDCIFYVVLLSHLSPSDKGISRAGLFLKEQNLFYKLTIDSLTSKLIPCGWIKLKEN